MPYYNNRKMRLAPEADNLQALFAEAEILAGSTNQQGQPKMVELIDTIMSIPSCIQVCHFSSHSLSNSLESQDQQSKIDVVNKWIKEHKKYEGSEEIEEINNNKTGSAAEEEVEDIEELKNKSDEVVDHSETLESEDIVSENFGAQKRRKHSKVSSKPGRKTLKKLKELDIATKNIYQSFEKEEELKDKILYKAFRPHKNFLLCFFLATNTFCSDFIF